MQRIHRGVGVSQGVAHGPVYVITPEALRVPRRSILPDEIGLEIDRFEAAVADARVDIERVRDALLSSRKEDEAAIFDTHLLILEDVELLEGTRVRIRDRRMNAEAAFCARVLDTVQRLEQSEDAYLRERTRDIREVEHRVVRILLGEREPAAADLLQDSILVAHDLPASLTAELDRESILGFATEVGSGNSHTAILARALEIPAVIGLGPILHRLSHGEPIILDGRNGLLIENPGEETIEEYERVRQKIEVKRAELVRLAGTPGQTADGTPLTFLANIEFPREVETALSFGCEGVGLYRTEYLFLQSGGEAEEEQQYRTYSMIVERMEGRPTTIRTIDLGGDKLLGGVEPEQNPFLGWRAVRYCLDRPEMFQSQLRAILRAAAHGPVNILFPMLSAVEEADAAIRHLEVARRDLEETGIPHGAECPVGALIETPAAALTADRLAERFDFLSLGTNDLIQYTMAVDRGNRRVSHLFQPFHPAVLRLVREVVEAADKNGCELTMCGEMGSDARATVALLGLGVRRFSMVPTRVPRVKQVLGKVRVEDAQEAVAEALRVDTAEAAWRIIDERFGECLEPVGNPSKGDPE